MGLFNELYGKNQEKIDARRKELVRGKVERGMNASRDSLEGEILENEVRIEDARIRVANGNIEYYPQIITLQVQIEELRAQIALMKDEFERFFGSEE